MTIEEMTIMSEKEIKSEKPAEESSSKATWKSREEKVKFTYKEQKEYEQIDSVIETLELNFRRDERVVRFLTVKQDKFSHEYALKRRNKKSGKKSEAAGKTERVEAEVNVNKKED